MAWRRDREIFENASFGLCILFIVEQSSSANWSSGCVISCVSPNGIAGMLFYRRGLRHDMGACFAIGMSKVLSGKFCCFPGGWWHRFVDLWKQEKIVKGLSPCPKYVVPVCGGAYRTFLFPCFAMKVHTQPITRVVDGFVLFRPACGQQGGGPRVLSVAHPLLQSIHGNLVFAQETPGMITLTACGSSL